MQVATRDPAEAAGVVSGGLAWEEWPHGWTANQLQAPGVDGE